MPEGDHIESEDSVEPGSASTCTPGQHRWMMLVATHGDIFGVDSLGHPVFVPSPDCEHEVVFGCADCDEPWTAASLDRLS